MARKHVTWSFCSFLKETSCRGRPLQASCAASRFAEVEISSLSDQSDDESLYIGSHLAH